MTTVVTTDPVTGKTVRVAYYVRADGTEVLMEVPPDKYDVEAMSPRQLETLAAFSESSAERFGKSGRVNVFVGEGVKTAMSRDPTPKVNRGEARREYLKALVGEKGLEAARKVGPGRRRARIEVGEKPRLLKRFEDISIPRF